jgi:hypothetical protein
MAQPNTGRAAAEYNTRPATLAGPGAMALAYADCDAGSQPPPYPNARRKAPQGAPSPPSTGSGARQNS